MDAAVDGGAVRHRFSQLGSSDFISGILGSRNIHKYCFVPDSVLGIAGACLFPHVFPQYGAEMVGKSEVSVCLEPHEGVLYRAGGAIEG